MTMYVRKTPSDNPAAGLYDARIDGNSPQNPARPGKPSEAIAQKPRIQPKRGMRCSKPPICRISRVW